jgi:hypothetical protein
LTLGPLSLCGALAAPAPAEAATERRVTVAATASNLADDPLAEGIDDALHAQVELHPAYTLADVPPQSIDEMLLSAGCASLEDADCRDTLRMGLESPLLAFATVRHGDAGSVWLQATLWDLEAGAVVRQRTTSVRVQGSGGSQLVVFARSLLYGDVGVLRVDSAPTGAAVLLDGRELGETPVEAGQLAPGVYDLEVRLRGYEPRVEPVTIDIVPTEVLWPLQPSASEAGWRVAPDTWLWVSGGAGVAGLLLGSVSSAAMASTQRDFDRVSSAAVLDRSRAEDLRSTGETQAMLANIGWAVSAAGIGTAVTLLMLRQDDPAGSEPTVVPVVSPGATGLLVNARL